MTARDAAFLGCRLMALWFGVNGLIQLPLSIAAQAYLAQMSHGEATLLERFVESSPLFIAAAHLVIAALLFYGATLFSGALVREPDAQIVPMSQKSFLASGALLIGIFTAARYLPGLVDSLIDSLSHSLGDAAKDSSTLVLNIVGITLAVLFLVGATLWAKRENKWDSES